MNKNTKRNPLFYVLFCAYIIVIGLFIMSTINLSSYYTKLEKQYLEDAKTAINEVFSTAATEVQLKESLQKVVDEYPMDLIVKDNEKSIFSTTTLTFTGMRDNVNKNITLLQFQGKYYINNKEYQVACNLFHMQNPEYLTNLTRYQIILIGVSILILITVSAVIQYILYKPLKQIKSSLNKFENFELDAVIEEETSDEINEKLRQIAYNLNENIEDVSRDYTQLEQALQVERERLKNTITVSRAFIHGLKSPLHQTMLENELVSKQIENISPQMETIINFNVRRLEKSMHSINEILAMMDQNIYDTNKMEETVDVVQILLEANKMFKPVLQKREVYLELEVPENLEVTTNKATLQLLIHNILSNAAAYASIDSEIFCELQETNEKYIIRCTNETTLENIERMKSSQTLFYKKDNDEEHRYSSGKGLFLIKELTHVLHGEYHINIKTTTVSIEIILMK